MTPGTMTALVLAICAYGTVGIAVFSAFAIDAMRPRVGHQKFSKADEYGFAFFLLFFWLPALVLFLYVRSGNTNNRKS